jgi:hypothetical protein
MSDTPDRLAQAFRDLVNEAVQAATIEHQPPLLAPAPPVDAERTWLDRKQVADRLHLPVRTLAAWASAGRGPRYYRIGRYARYRLSDVMAWEEEQLA